MDENVPVGTKWKNSAFYVGKKHPIPQIMLFGRICGLDLALPTYSLVCRSTQAPQRASPANKRYITTEITLAF